ncbi:MAG: hypothetical protein E7L06_02935 [Schaalia turicensis]|nr:hypothetical protein [Schaalia turicensis]
MGDGIVINFAHRSSMSNNNRNDKLSISMIVSILLTIGTVITDFFGMNVELSCSTPSTHGNTFESSR